MSLIHSRLFLCGFVALTQCMLAACTHSAAKVRSQEAPLRCTAELPGELVLNQAEFRWDYSPSELEGLFREIYESPKRLAGRAYFETENSSHWVELDHKKIRLPETFVREVTRHLETALRAGYALAVFHADLGHAHFLVPVELYQNVIDPIPPERLEEAYRILFSDPSVKLIYHAAERLNPRLADPKLVLRQLQRNLIGDSGGHLEVNVALGKNQNTLTELEGYRFWGAGITLSSNRRACFPYQSGSGTAYFDLSLDDH